MCVTGKLSMSPSKEGDKLPPYPGLHLYPGPPHPHPPPLREDANDEADFMAACHSMYPNHYYVYNMRVLLKQITLFTDMCCSYFSVWGPDPTYKLQDDNSDKGNSESCSNLCFSIVDL